MHKSRRVVFSIVGWLEFVVSVFALVGITSHLFGFKGFWDLFCVSGLSDFLKYLFDALIGIEFIKLLCKNDFASMVEVLLFAVTRHLIIQHLETWELLLGVLAIAALFAVRRFLLVRTEKNPDKKPEPQD